MHDTTLKDEVVQKLAAALHELLATANTVSNLLEIQYATNVIEDISNLALQAALLIDEYTKLNFAS